MASRPFWDDLYAAGAEIVLNGHVHDYERFNPQRPDGTADPAGIAQFVVGTGGKSLESTGSPGPGSNSAVAAQTFGVLELTLKPGGYDYRFLTAAGAPAFSDAGNANCH
jgi:predicted flavoprotein YhiN